MNESEISGIQADRVFRKLDRLAPWLLMGLGILFFADPLFSDKNFYFRDILDFHYPLRRVLIGAWARGEFPLWNPFIYFGQPMLANPNYMALYPTNLFHLLLPFDYAFKLHFIIHPLLAGPGIYVLQRRLAIHPLAALGGAFAYQFSGTLLSFLNLYNILPAVALLPWIGWAFYGALQEQWLRRSLAFGGLLAIQIVALEPLMFQCNMILIAGLALYFISESGDRKRGVVQIARVGASGAAFALGLAAVQILPTMEMIPRAIRGAGVDFTVAGRWSLHPMDFLNTIIPNLFGNPFAIGYASSWGEAYHHGDTGFLVSVFIGTSTILLALLSFSTRRKFLHRTFLFIALGTTFLALGRFNPAYRWLYDHVPGFGFGRYPSKYFLLATLALSVMAALGLESMMAKTGPQSEKPRYWAFGAVGILMGLTLIAAAIHWQIHPEPLVAWLRSQIEPQQLAAKDFGDITRGLLHSLFSSGAFLALGGGLIILARFWHHPVALCGIWLILVLAELFPAGLRLAPLISGADVDFIPEIDRFVLAYGPKEPFRVVAPNWLSPIPNRLRAPNRSLAWMTLYNRMTAKTMGGIQSGIQYSLDNSIDLLNTAESEEIYSRCLQLPVAHRIRLMEKLNSPIVLSIGALSHPDLRALASFDTRSEYRLFAYALSRSMPRAYMAFRTVPATSPEDALQRLLRPESTLPPEVILEGMAPDRSVDMGATGLVKILKYESQRVLCEAESSSAGYLVLLDSYYPGWSARVDGKETRIIRANYGFRAVALPAGRHKVEFVYRPRTFYIGLALTLGTLLFGLFVAVAAKMRKAREPH